jgi:hypothetical protein
VECVEFGDEIIVVFVVIGHPLHRSDLVVDASERATGDRLVVPIKNACTIPFQRIGHGNQNSDSVFAVAVLHDHIVRGVGVPLQ